MKQETVFIPVLLHMLLIFVLYIKLGRVKSRAVREGSVDRKVTALDATAWPNYVVKVNNNIVNQFESPVLFYMLAMILYSTNNVGLVTLSLFGLYVASRYFHAFFHIGRNYVPNRYRAFVVGLLLLLGLVVWLLQDIVRTLL